jgi:hypothetical protein
MVNTLFTNAFAFVSINNALSPWILLHRSIRQGCPSAPYLYVLMVDALGYLLESTRIARKVPRHSAVGNGFEMVNNHFVDDSLLFEC